MKFITIFNKIFFVNLITNYFPNLSSIQKEQLESLPSLYQSWNSKINVISRKDINFLFLRHVLHSLAIAKVIKFYPGSSVLDVGTGSGCISICHAMLRPDLKILASDISSDALDVATINLQNYEVNNVLLIKSNWLSYAKTESLDLVISNPPYLKPDDIHLINLIHEPQSALVSPKGVKSFLEISQQAFIALKHGGRIIFEHGFSQRLEVTSILEDCGFKNIISEPDLQGLDRFIYAQKL